MGIYFTPEKQEAILKGDTSNTVVNPMFVYQACSYGSHISQSFMQSPHAHTFQEKYSQLVWEELAKTKRGNNDELKAQAMLSISACCLILRWMDVASQYLHKSCRIINTANLRFIPTCGRPPAYSEEIRERSAVLSQVIYYENYLFLACGGPEPELTARIEKEFRYELQVGKRGACKFARSSSISRRKRIRHCSRSVR